MGIREFYFVCHKCVSDMLRFNFWGMTPCVLVVTGVAAGCEEPRRELFGSRI